MALSCAVAKAKLAQAVSALKESKLSDRIVSGIKTGELATLTSRVKHISSVALTMGYRGLVEQPVHVAVDYVQAIGKAAIDNKLGQFQQYRTTTNLISPKAIGAIGKAGAQGLREAIQAIKTGVDPERADDVFDLGKVTLKNPLLRAIQNRINTVVSASNKPFFNMALQASLLDQAQTLAKKSGLGADYHLSHISDEMAQRALDEATHSTFGDNNVISKGLSGFTGMLKRARDNEPTLTPRQRAGAQATKEGLIGDAATERAHQLLTLPRGQFEKAVTVPREVGESSTSKTLRATAGVALPLVELTTMFSRIGLNLAGRGAELTPLGIPIALAKALSVKDGQIAIDGITKATAGTASLVALGYYLSSKGVLTGARTGNPGKNNVQTAEGEQAYSVDIGGSSHRYDWMEPISFAIALGADLHQQLQANPNDKTGAFLKAEGENLKMLSEKTVLHNFAQVGDAAGGDATAGVRYLTGLLAPVVAPPLLGQIAKQTDAAANRDTRAPTFAGQVENQIKSRIPGLRETLPIRTDVFGKATERTGSPLLDPGSPTKITKDRVTDELDRLGVGISSLGTKGTIGKKPFIRTPGEQDAMNTEFGPELHAKLEAALDNPVYQNKTDAGKVAALKYMIKQSHRQATFTDKARRIQPQ